MHPRKAHLEDLIARVGFEQCRSYAAAIRSRESLYLESRRMDPESVLILNLTIREEGLAADHDCNSWLFVSEDAFGNYYFVDSTNEPSVVKLLSHDPPGIEHPRLTLSDLIAKAEVHDLFDTRSGCSLSICRADHPRRSVLDSIALEEWLAVATLWKEIDTEGCRRGINPFTGEEMQFRAKGGASIEWEGSTIHVALWAGRLHFGEVPRSFVPFAETLAQSLKASVFYDGKQIARADT